MYSQYDLFSTVTCISSVTIRPLYFILFINYLSTSLILEQNMTLVLCAVLNSETVAMSVLTTTCA